MTLEIRGPTGQLDIGLFVNVGLKRPKVEIVHGHVKVGKDRGMAKRPIRGDRS